MPDPVKSFSKLSIRNIGNNADMYSYLVKPDEVVVMEYTATLDTVVFTSDKIIAITAKTNGKEQESMVIPYSKISAYAIKTAGVWGLVPECTIWVNGLGEIELKFLTDDNDIEVKRLASVFTKYVC